MSSRGKLGDARDAYHKAISDGILSLDAKGIPSNADKDNTLSIQLACGLASRLGASRQATKVSGQRAGSLFEEYTAAFLKETFSKLIHLRPGRWQVEKVTSRRGEFLAQYYQYEHIAALKSATEKNPELAAALGSDYLITPDIVVARSPETDEVINSSGVLVDENISRLTSLRRCNNELPILHASISCKWTIRSDRVQNARSEGLNLLKNRKGSSPHAVVVMAEPLPSRIAAIALGTGEIDCVYHVALPELVDAVSEAKKDDAAELLHIMISGRRLKDIADLPLDLAV